MGNELVDRVRHFAGIWCRTSFNFFSSIVYLALEVIKIFGAVSALLLLHKLYPEISASIFKSLFLILSILFQFLKISAWVFGVSVGCIISAYIYKLIMQIKQNQIQKREEFLDDLAKRIKRKK